MPAKTVSSYQDAVEEICRSLSEGRLAVFCGAGISLDSGIPLASTLRSNLLDALGAHDNERELILAAKIPFEGFMEQILDHIPPDRHQSLLEIFRCGVPNANHLLIAKLAAAGLLRLVYTTNFDSHIETALQQPHGSLRMGRDFFVLSREGHFPHADYGKINVFKLHGTIDDIDSIRVTLRSICADDLRNPRQKCIEDMFSADQRADTLLILGYSLSDIYDVIPGIVRARATGKRIIFVQHIGDPDPRVGSLNDLAPFLGYEGVCVVVRTSELVAQIWRTFFIEVPPTIASGSQATENLERWRQSLSLEPDGASLISTLLFNVAAHRESLDRAVEVAASAATADEQAQAWMTIERAAGRLRNREGPVWPLERLAAIAKLSATLAAEGGRDNLARSAWLDTCVGSSLTRVGALERALEYHERGLDRALQSGAKEAEALCWMNMSATFGAMGDRMNSEQPFRMVISCARRALSIYRDLENAFHEGTCLMNLGSALHMLSDYGAAEASFVEAHARFVKCELSWHEGYIRRKLAEVRARWGGRF